MGWGNEVASHHMFGHDVDDKVVFDYLFGHLSGTHIDEVLQLSLSIPLVLHVCYPLVGPRGDSIGWDTYAA
jgi:hypothetical protein